MTATIQDAALLKAVGAPPPTTTHWGIQRETQIENAQGDLRSRRREALDWEGHEGLRVRSWPLSELSIDVIRSRWGKGCFRISYLAQDETGKENPVGTSRRFTIEDPTPARATMTAPQSQAEPVDPFLRQLNMMQTMMAMSDARTNQTVNSLVQLAGIGQNKGELTAVMTMMMQMQQASEARLIALMTRLAPGAAPSPVPAAPPSTPTPEVDEREDLPWEERLKRSLADRPELVADFLKTLLTRTPAPTTAPTLPTSADGGAPPPPPPPVRPVRAVAPPPVPYMGSTEIHAPTPSPRDARPDVSTREPIPAVG